MTVLHCFNEAPDQSDQPIDQQKNSNDWDYEPDVDVYVFGCAFPTAVEDYEDDLEDYEDDLFSDSHDIVGKRESRIEENRVHCLDLFSWYRLHPDQQPHVYEVDQHEKNRRYEAFVGVEDKSNYNCNGELLVVPYHIVEKMVSLDSELLPDCGFECLDAGWSL